MPQLPFADEHKANVGINDFPRLKLDKDERARILCLENPTFAYVHELRAPKIVDGKPHMVTIERNGSKTTDFEKDFIGRPLCLGDIGALLDKGVDPKNCPACQRSTISDEVDKPKRRFAMPVIRYATKGGSFELRTPFSCELVVWSYTDKVYNKLVDIVKEWGEDGRIRNHDLNIVCTNQAFQQLEINVAATAAWQADEDRAKHVLATYNDNKPADLEQFCGRRVERKWMEQDIEKVRERWAIANGRSVAPRDDDNSRSLAEGLDDLLNKANAPAEDVEVGGIEALNRAPDAAAKPEPKPEAKPEAETKPAPKAETKTAEAIDFAELLNSLP